VAFVVGTDKYDNLDNTRQLQRAVNDARAVGVALKALGFELVAAENLTRGQFNSEWQKFLDKLAAGDTAAIYYAGHGVEIEGLNFLLPRDIPDIRFGRQEQIKRESLSVAEMLLDLRTRNPEIALVILDACRDNPLIPDELRSAGTRGGGLAPLKGEPPKGTFIMYSAGAGESALDRLPGNDPDPRNSIFTRKLLPLLATRGLALHDLARQLRADVLQLASTVPHTQRPAYYDGVIGKYCLAGCEDATPKRAEPLTIEDRVSAAARRWETLRNSTNLADLEAFAALYGDTYFAGMATARINDLKRTQAISKSYTIKQSDDQKRALDAAREQDAARVAALPKQGQLPAEHMVVLTSHRTRADAEKSIATLQDKYRTALGTYTLEIREANLGSGKGIWYRGVVAKLGSAHEASKLCDALKAVGADCIISLSR
jgi:hypothetical protein